MKLGLPIVWSDRHRLQEPGGEVWNGARTPGTEVPRRAEASRDALGARDAPFADARAHRADGVVAARDAASVNLAYARTGEARGVPSSLVKEGGYDLTTIGTLVAETLAGVPEGATRA